MLFLLDALLVNQRGVSSVVPAGARVPGYIAEGDSLGSDAAEETVEIGFLFERERLALDDVECGYSAHI